MFDRQRRPHSHQLKEFLNILLKHPHTTVGGGCANARDTIGAVEACPIFFVCPEAHPAAAKGIIGGATGHEFPSEWVNPLGIFIHGLNLKLARWGFPTRSPHRDWVGLKGLTAPK